MFILTKYMDISYPRYLPRYVSTNPTSEYPLGENLLKLLKKVNGVKM